MAAPAFLERPITRTLVTFSLPILASSVLQALNGSVNAAWIGRLIGNRALTGAANANSLIFMLAGAVFGLGLSTTVMVGQALGAKNLALAKRAVGTGTAFFAGVAAVLAVIGYVLAPQLLAAMHTPDDALDLAVDYLRVLLVALPGVYLYTFVMMALRGAGDARTPFVFLAFSVAIDIGLTPLLIQGAGPIPAFGITGAGLASLIAQWICLAALIGWLYLRKHPLCIRRDELHFFRVDRTILSKLVGKGVPMGLQILLTNTAALVMISFVNHYGSQTTAAYGAANQLWNYLQMPAFAVGSAVSSMAAQNIGAQRWDRVAQIARAGVACAAVATAALIGALMLCDRAALAMFLGADSPSLPIALHLNAMVAWSYLPLVIGLVLFSLIRATGTVMAPLAIVFVAYILVRLGFVYAAEPRLAADAIWWGFPAGAFALTVASAGYYRWGRWRSARMLDTRAPAPAPAAPRADAEQVAS
ncbi:MAG TPA: MATE family efflux transporter [Kofleriaceae bacterium]|nr:MATE family efflux transporter [Kofleriaceae bacterium]